MKRASCRLRAEAGFSLTEVLVTITILGIIAALTFPVFGNMQAQAKRSECANNLRQIGIALNLFVGDNANRLPKSWVSTPCNVHTREPDRFGPLSGHLARYLGHDTPSMTEKVFVPEFQCPAYPSQLTAAEALEAGAGNHITYRLVYRLNSSIPLLFGNATTPPLKLSALESATGEGLATIPLLFNMDQGLPLYHGSDVPQVPVHGAGRNVLFFDGRVSFEKDNEFLLTKFR